ncbi:DUF2569 domain-containing protein [Providencia sp. Me31A]|uniref:DUF2569 domain-containing protein n=1 Tax=Providencia sp. Me31A TaxID=3392637 RepID=UPI003D29B223
MKIEDGSSPHSTPIEPPKPIPELKGIAGWLILPMLGIVLSLITLPFFVYQNNIQVIEYWSELTDPLSNSFIPLFKELIYFEILSNVILYAILLFLCYIFFTKKKLTIRVYIFFHLFSLVLTTLDIILANVLLDLDIDASDVRDIFHELIVCAIWIPYFLVSIRVKNTFVN